MTFTGYDLFAIAKEGASLRHQQQEVQIVDVTMQVCHLHEPMFSLDIHG